VTTNHATAVCQSGYQPIITSPLSSRRAKTGARASRTTMIIWHNNQLHSIVFSGTKQIIFSFRLGLVALPATCYLAPWQWPVTAARPLLSRSRGPLNSAPGAACASPTTVLQPAHGGLLYRTKTMLHFHPRRRPRAPLDARTPSLSGPWQILSESRSVASGPNGPPNRACRKRSRRLSTSSPRTGGPKRSWVSLIRAS
jgi:hypothetical protein